MTSFVLDDRHRSLRRYVAFVLGAPPWTVRTEREVIADDARPAAVVELNSPTATLFAKATVPQGSVRKMQGFSVMAYPVLADTARESRAGAEEVAQLLDDLITIGLQVGENEHDVDPQTPIGAPFRMPVWDFSAVPVSGATRGIATTVDEIPDPYGYASVDNVFTRVIQDPIDHLRFTVACDLRLRWWQGGRVPPDAETLEAIHPHYQP